MDWCLAYAILILLQKLDLFFSAGVKTALENILGLACLFDKL